jgi:isocitrate lyase
MSSFSHEVEALDRWFKSERFAETLRPYGAQVGGRLMGGASTWAQPSAHTWIVAQDVAALRGSLRTEYPSHIQAQKLWRLLTELKVCPALPPVSPRWRVEGHLSGWRSVAVAGWVLAHVRRAGPRAGGADGPPRDHHLRQRLAVLLHRLHQVCKNHNMRTHEAMSGGVSREGPVVWCGVMHVCCCSNEPGPDFADYPMDTVPNKVHQLFSAQLFHDRRQCEVRAWRPRARRGGGGGEAPSTGG